MTYVCMVHSLHLLFERYCIVHATLLREGGEEGGEEGGKSTNLLSAWLHVHMYVS